MLGQQKKQTVPGWSIFLVAVLLLLAAVLLFARTMGGEMKVGLLDWGTNRQERAQLQTPPPIEVLRAAKTDFTGGFIPESTKGDQTVPVSVLRAAKPDFFGSVVPESTMDDQVISIGVLRAAKPDFAGGVVPESTKSE
jgi:hypothetical protein